jgi:hypothetical protein
MVGGQLDAVVHRRRIHQIVIQGEGQTMIPVAVQTTTRINQE